MLLTLGEVTSGVNMPFTHDTEAALVSTAALVNTRPHGRQPDGLTTMAELEAEAAHRA